MSTPTQTAPTFQSAAQAIYDKLVTDFKTSSDGTGNRWTYGNTFDSMLDYLMLSQKQGGDVLEPALKTFDYPAVWYDDFCWPAIASLKAFDPDYANVFAGTQRLCASPINRVGWQLRPRVAVP